MVKSVLIQRSFLWTIECWDPSAVRIHVLYLLYIGCRKAKGKKMDRQNLAKPCQVRSIMLDPLISRQKPAPAPNTPATAEASGPGFPRGSVMTTAQRRRCSDVGGEMVVSSKAALARPWFCQRPTGWLAALCVAAVYFVHTSQLFPVTLAAPLLFEFRLGYFKW